METIKEILGGVVRAVERRRAARDDIDTWWRQAVRKRMGQHTKARRMKGAILYIDVANPAWLHEVRMQKVAIEKKLNKLSHNKIKGIYARVGAIDE